MASDLALSGIVSGLDTSTVIAQLMSIEKRPVTLMQQQQAKQQNVLDHLRTLNTKLLALETSAKALMGSGTQTSSPFAAKTATSSDTSVFTVASDSNATPGTYSVDVLSLATTQRLGGNAYAGPTTAGTLEISNGTQTATINVTAGESATSIASKINADSQSGLSAAVVGGRLVLQGKSSGAAENYTVTETAGSGNLLSEIGLQAAGTDIAGADAQIRVAGITITSGTNKFEDAVNGVDITAVAVGAGKSVTVANNTGTTVAAVKDLVAKYNDIITQIKADTKYDAATKSGGVLLGDPFASSLTTMMNRMVTEAFGTGSQNGGLLNYTDVGIQVQRDGTLTLDETKLTTKLASNPNEVYALFAREDGATDSGDSLVKLNQGANGGNMGDGIANRLRAYANSMINASSDYNFRDGSGTRYEGGLLNRINSATKQIATYSDRIDDYNRRLEKREATLRAQFTAMETAISNLKNQASYLTNGSSSSGS